MTPDNAKTQTPTTNDIKTIALCASVACCAFYVVLVGAMIWGAHVATAWHYR